MELAFADSSFLIYTGISSSELSFAIRCRRFRLTEYILACGCSSYGASGTSFQNAHPDVSRRMTLTAVVYRQHTIWSYGWIVRSRSYYCTDIQRLVGSMIFLLKTWIRKHFTISVYQEVRSWNEGVDSDFLISGNYSVNPLEFNGGSLCIDFNIQREWLMTISIFLFPTWTTFSAVLLLREFL